MYLAQSVKFYCEIVYQGFLWFFVIKPSHDVFPVSPHTDSDVLIVIVGDVFFCRQLWFLNGLVRVNGWRLGQVEQVGIEVIQSNIRFPRLWICIEKKSNKPQQIENNENMMSLKRMTIVKVYGWIKLNTNESIYKLPSATFEEFEKSTFLDFGTGASRSIMLNLGRLTFLEHFFAVSRFLRFIFRSFV